eukprot:PhM_4_TR8444/c0_g2_i15/m.51339
MRRSFSFAYRLAAPSCSVATRTTTSTSLLFTYRVAALHRSRRQHPAPSQRLSSGDLISGDAQTAKEQPPQPNERSSTTTPELAQKQQQLAHDRLFEKHGKKKKKITDDDICDTLLEHCIKITLHEFKTLRAALRSGNVAGVTETLKSTCLFPKEIAGLVTDMSSVGYWEKTLKPQGDATKQEQFIQDAFQRKGYKVDARCIISTIESMDNHGQSRRFMRQLDLLRAVCKDLEEHVLFDQLIERLRNKQCKKFYGQYVFVEDGKTTMAPMESRDPLGGQQLPCLSFEVPSSEISTNQTLVFVGESGCGKTVAMISFPAFLGTRLNIDSLTTFVCYGFSYLSDYTPLPKPGDKTTPEWKARRNDHVLGHIANHLANKILKNDTTNALEDLLTAATQKPVC